MGVNKNSENLELAKEFCAFFCENMALALGMNEIMIDGGENQPDLAFLQDLDYVMLPVMNGGEPEYDKLNELWGKNFQ